MAGLADFDAYAGLIPAEQIAGAKDRAIAAMLANFGAAMTGAGQQGLGLAGGFAQGALGASKAMDDARTGVVQEALLGGQLDQRRDEMAKRAALAKLAGDPRAGQMLGPLAPLLQFMTPDALAKLQQDQADRAAGMAAIGAMTGGQGLGGFSPTTPLVGPGAGYAQRVAGQESGGDPRATNPHSGAGGLYQFMPQTWEAARRAIPGLPARPQDATPEQQGAAERWYTQTNIAALTNQLGRTPTGGEARLAHFVGAGAAPTFLRMDPATPIASLPADFWQRHGERFTHDTFLAQNPQVRGMTVGQLVGQYRQQFDATPPNVATPTQGDIPREVIMAAQLLASQGKGADAAKLIAEARQKAMDTARAEREFAYRQQQDALTRGDRQGDQAESLTTTLRNEITKSKPYQDWITVQPIFDSMKASAARQSKASDLDLVYGLAKLMDPGSVVREGEMILVQRAGGPIEAIRGMIESVNGGAAITPQVRAEIMQTAQQRVEAHHNAFQALFEPIKGIATRRKIAIDDIAPGVGKYEPFDPKTIGQTPRQTAPGAPAPAPTQAPPVIEWERVNGVLRPKKAP